MTDEAPDPLSPETTPAEQAVAVAVQADDTKPVEAEPLPPIVTPGDEIAAAKTYAEAEKKSLLEKLHVLIADIESLPAEAYAEIKAFAEKHL